MVENFSSPPSSEEIEERRTVLWIRRADLSRILLRQWLVGCRLQLAMEKVMPDVCLMSEIKADVKNRS